MDNSTLPLPPVVQLYSIAKNKLMRDIRPPHWYNEAGFFIFDFNIVEMIGSSQKPSIEAVSYVDSVTGLVSTLFGDY